MPSACRVSKFQDAESSIARAVYLLCRRPVPFLYSLSIESLIISCSTWSHTVIFEPTSCGPLFVILRIRAHMLAL